MPQSEEKEKNTSSLTHEDGDVLELANAGDEAVANFANEKGIRKRTIRNQIHYGTIAL